MYFPKLTVTDDYLPAGNSKPYCLHLDWYLRAKSSLFANYKSVTGIETNCTDYNNPKVLWPKGDPGDGLSFQAFKQYKSAPNFDGSCPQQNGVNVKTTPDAPSVCYSYEYLAGLCMLVKYT